MELKPPLEVVKQLQSRVLRVRTGIWLIPKSYLGHEADEAVRLGIEAVDLRKDWLDKLLEDTRFIGVTPDKVLERLDEIAESPDSSDCALIYNIDLLLAYMKQSGRKTVWEGLYNGMPHRSCGLLIAMPIMATYLLPSLDDLHHWRQENRLAGTIYPN